MSLFIFSIVLSVLVAVLTVAAAWLDLAMFDRGLDEWVKQFTTKDEPDIPASWVRAHWWAYLPGGGFALRWRYPLSYLATA